MELPRPSLPGSVFHTGLRGGPCLCSGKIGKPPLSPPCFPEVQPACPAEAGAHGPSIAAQRGARPAPRHSCCHDAWASATALIGRINHCRGTSGASDPTAVAPTGCGREGSSLPFSGPCFHHVWKGLNGLNSWAPSHAKLPRVSGTSVEDRETGSAFKEMLHPNSLKQNLKK